MGIRVYSLLWVMQDFHHQPYRGLNNLNNYLYIYIYIFFLGGGGEGFLIMAVVWYTPKTLF